MFRRGGCHLLGIFAVALGAGILIAAIFPVGALLFLVAMAADRLRLRLLPQIGKEAKR